MDGLHNYLKYSGLTQDDILTIKRKLENEEYDSDGLMDDVKNSENGEQSNIFLLLTNNRQYQQIYQYAYEIRCMYQIVSRFLIHVYCRYL